MKPLRFFRIVVQHTENAHNNTDAWKLMETAIRVGGTLKETEYYVGVDPKDVEAFKDLLPSIDARIDVE